MSASMNGGGALSLPESLSVPAPQSDDFLPSERMMQFCSMIAQSNMVPKDFRGRPGDVMIAVQMGMEVGLKPMQALQSIAVINGRPALWGDGALAVVRARPDCDDIVETVSGESEARVATCTITRRGRTPVVRTFSVADAKKAGLFGKEGPWRNYPDRMLQMRARGFALRDAFPDALKGFAIAEEAMDIPVDAIAAPTHDAAPATRTEQVKESLRARVVDVAPVPRETEQSVEPAQPSASAEEELSRIKARDLRNAIAKAWQHVAPEKRAEILKQQFGRNQLVELNVVQLEDFLARTPELLPMEMA